MKLRKKIVESVVTWAIIATICLAIVSVLGANGYGCNTPPTREKRFSFDSGDILIEYKPNSVVSGNKKIGSYYYIVRYTPSNETIAHEMKDFETEQHIRTHEITKETVVPTSGTDGQLDVLARRQRDRGYNLIESGKLLNFADYETWQRYKTRYLIATQLVEEGADEAQQAAALKEEWKKFIFDSWLKVAPIAIALYDKNGHSLLTTGFLSYPRAFWPSKNTTYTYDARLIDGETLQWKGQFYEDWLTFENFQDIDYALAEYLP